MVPPIRMCLNTSVSDLNVTIVQPRNMNIMGKTTFTNFLSFVLHTPKTVLFISYIFFSVFFKNTKKLKGKFLTCAKRTIHKFDPIKVVLPLKFKSLGCTMVTLRSETLLYIRTPQWDRMGE